MEMSVYAIFDSKAQAYLQPFFAVNNEVAKRTFEAATSDDKSTFGLFPGDYTLFKVAVWDNESGAIDKVQAYENLGTGLQMGKPEELRQVGVQGGE